ncbi:MAG: DJ-1/PfpI family protein [Candidatus Micrarchaeia archaeon]
MRVAIVIPPKDFKDETVAGIKLMLEKWHVQVIVSSYTSEECIGYHGAIYKPGIDATKLGDEKLDAVVFADGPGVDEYKLYDFRPLLDMVRNFNSSGTLIGAIGNAVKIIARANIINGVHISVPNDGETIRLVQLYKGIPSGKSVELEKNIISAKGHESATEFSNAVLDRFGLR